MLRILTILKKTPRNVSIGFLIAVFCSGPMWAFANNAEFLFQERTVSGTVTSADDGQAYPGVNIIIKGSTVGTVSDSNGKYSLNVSSSDAVLVFSAIGFSTQEVAVGSRATVDVVMQTDVTALSEVVVVGYGTQEKREITASIASIGSEFNEQARLGNRIWKFRFSSRL